MFLLHFWEVFGAVLGCIKSIDCVLFVISKELGIWNVDPEPSSGLIQVWMPLENCFIRNSLLNFQLLFYFCSLVVSVPFDFPSCKSTYGLLPCNRGLYTKVPG
jgi:hypothetical protein